MAQSHKDRVQPDNGIIRVVRLIPTDHGGIIGLGALVSHSRNIVRIGQVFLDKSWNSQVYQTPPSNFSASRTQASSAGNSSDMSFALGVDSRAVGNIYSSRR